MSNCFACGKSDAHAGKEARADVDSDRAELADLDVGLPTDEFDGRRERLRVAAPTRQSEDGKHTFVSTDCNTHLLRGGLDSENQHLQSQTM